MRFHNLYCNIVALIIAQQDELNAARKALWAPPASGNYTLSDFHKLVESNPTKEYMIIRDQVLEVTGFARDHPGGPRYIKMFAGKDATHDFYGSLNNHTKSARLLVDDMTIGKLVPDVAPAAEPMAGHGKTD